jgi:hypothetical protein
MPVEDTPYGALGCVKDPNGAFIQIATPAAGPVPHDVELHETQWPSPTLVAAIFGAH